jgi:hypothetical protein
VNLTAAEWIALAAVVVPAGLLIVGIRLNRVLEIEREDRQRAEDRKRRENEAQRAVVADLQDALTDLQIGTGVAVSIANFPQQANPKGDKLDVDAAWYLDWLRAEQRVYVLSSRLGSEELKQHARDFVEYKNSIQSKIVVSDPKDLTGFKTLIEEIAVEIGKAQELAGRLYQDFGPVEPVEEKRPLWKRLVVG